MDIAVLIVLPSDPPYARPREGKRLLDVGALAPLTAPGANANAAMGDRSPSPFRVAGIAALTSKVLHDFYFFVAV